MSPTWLAAWLPETEAEVTAQIREALEFHFEGIRADGEPIPQPASRVEYIKGVQSTSGSRANQADGMCGYGIVIEQGPVSYGAYVPDLPGCVAVAETKAEVRRLIREAIVFHLDLEGMRLKGEAISQPTSRLGYVEVVESDLVA